MLVVLSKVNNVVNRQTNQYNYRDWFIRSELPPLINHHGHDAHKHDGYADNWPNCQQHVAWHDSENDKRKDECNQNTLHSWLDESPFYKYPSEVNSSCEFTTLQTLRSIHNVFSHVLLPLFVNWVKIGVCVPLFSNWGSVYFKIHKLAILDFQDSLCLKESSKGWLNKSNKFILKLLWLNWQLFVVNSDCFCIISHTDWVPYTWFFRFFIFVSDVLVENLKPTVNLPWRNKCLVSEILAKLQDTFLCLNWRQVKLVIKDNLAKIRRIPISDLVFVDVLNAPKDWYSYCTVLRSDKVIFKSSLQALHRMIIIKEFLSFGQRSNLPCLIDCISCPKDKDQNDNVATSKDTSIPGTSKELFKSTKGNYFLL